MIKQRALVVSRFTLAAIATLAVSAPPRAGRAFEPDSHPCFKRVPNWNAENGALVSGISSGPVSAIFTALNQSRTHVMLANVTPGGYFATESTTRKPSVQSIPIGPCVGNVCLDTGRLPVTTMPIQPLELAQGSPGISQINMGGAYAYWSGATQVFRQVNPRSSTKPGCDTYCQINAVANWLWFDVPYEIKTSAASSNAWYYSLNPTDDFGTNAHMSYGVHQFMDGYARVRLGTSGETPAMRGIACSQVPAWGFRNWILQTSEDVSPYKTYISTHQYSHSVTVDAGLALWNSVYQGCMNQDTGFWAAYVNAFTALLDFVRSKGTALHGEDLRESDLIIPPPDLTLAEAERDFTGDGLLPD